MTKSLSIKELILDSVSVILFTWGLSFAASDIIGMDISIFTALKCAVIAAVIIVLVSRRWWIILSVLVLGICTAVLLSLLGIISFNAENLILFWNWLSAGLPDNSKFSSSYLKIFAELLPAIPSALIMFIVVRKFCYTQVVLLCCTVFVGFLWSGKYECTQSVLGIFAAAFIVLLPRDYNNFLRKKKISDSLLPRTALQSTALLLSAVCVFLTFLIVPEDTSKWTSHSLISMVNDIGDYFDANFGDGMQRTEFSISEEGFAPLGEKLGGPIKLDNLAVLKVETEHPVFLRGGISDVYTGDGWTDSGYYSRMRWSSILWRSARRSVFQLNLPIGGSQTRELYNSLTSDVELEIQNRNVGYKFMFTCGQMSSLSFEDSIEPYFDAQPELFTTESMKVFSEYTVKSRIYDRSLPNFDENFRSLEKLTADKKDSYLKDIENVYLQLPDMPQSVAELSRNITEGIDSNYDKACAIEKWLSNNCEYTLLPDEPPDDVDFVAHFLETREGYCVYFASAMTVMARSIGLPARYVTGFGLKSDTQRGSYLATGATAHACTEVYFKGIGWVTFDPLNWQEVVEINTYTEPQSESDTEPIVNPETPSEPIEPEPVEEPEIVQKPVENKHNLSWIWISGVSILLAALTLVLSVPVFKSIPIKRYRLINVMSRCKTPEEAMEKYYADIIRQLGFFRLYALPGETIRTFAARVEKLLDEKGFVKICGAVERMRFGNITPTALELRDAEDYHARLENTLKKHLMHKYLTRRAIPMAFRKK